MSTASSERIARKMTYEKERRERISQLFKDLAEALIDAGLPQEAADTQVEALESAIDIVKKWKKCQACETDGGLQGDFSITASPSELDQVQMKTSRSSATLSTTSSRPSLSASTGNPDIGRRHSSDVTLNSAELSSLSKTSLKRRRSFESIPHEEDTGNDSSLSSSTSKRRSPSRKPSPPSSARGNESTMAVNIAPVSERRTMSVPVEPTYPTYFASASSQALSPMIAIYPPSPVTDSLGFSMPSYAAPFSASYSMPAQSSTPVFHAPLSDYHASLSDSFEGSGELVEDLRLIDRMDYYSDSEDL